MTNFSGKLENMAECDLTELINVSDPHYASLASEELTRRKFTDFDKSTTHFSKVLCFFAVVQIVIALMQFILSVQTMSQEFVVKLFILISLFIVIIVIYNKFSKIIYSQK